ncbi:hypothetical protein [Aliiglaciecola lipolytica]|uniref:hypothetical protein n=1 Tax=Aliiglaciecola lipolytica TaxID=477689 RepID=UPI00058AE00D|nr:hypothetical protein [Aliiglaciecola lipolytica]
MSTNKKNWFEKVLIWVIFLYAIHWMFAGLWANLVIKECRDGAAANEAICDCKKSVLRNTLYLEFFLYSAITEDELIGRDVARGLYHASYHCR